MLEEIGKMAALVPDPSWQSALQSWIDSVTRRFRPLFLTVPGGPIVTDQFALWENGPALRQIRYARLNCGPRVTSVGRQGGSYRGAPEKVVRDASRGHLVGDFRALVPMLKLARIDIDVHTVDGDEVLSREVRQACSQTLPCQLSVCKLGYEKIPVLPEFSRPVPRVR